MTSREKQFANILDGMEQLFKEKDSAYGASFTKNFTRFGLNYPLTRMYEKLDRIKNLNDNEGLGDNNESIIDNLLDIANIAVLALMEVHNTNDKGNIERMEEELVKETTKSKETLDEVEELYKQLKASSKYNSIVKEATVRMERARNKEEMLKVADFLEKVVKEGKENNDPELFIKELEMMIKVTRGELNPVEALFAHLFE